jgi:hypothetical protein
MSAAVASQSTATGALTTQIPLAGAALCAAALTGLLTAGAGFSQCYADAIVATCITAASMDSRSVIEAVSVASMASLVPDAITATQIGADSVSAAPTIGAERIDSR